MYAVRLSRSSLFCFANPFTISVISNSLEQASLPLDILERKQEVIALSAKAQRLSVHQQLYFLGTGDHIDIFLRTVCVIPVPHNMNPRPLNVHPAVPHHPVCKKAVLGDTHRVNLAAPPVVFCTAIMRVCVGEDNISAAGADPFARARSLAPVVVPANHVLDCM
ncbi:hypothetical protein ES703_86631 [subsurface metagenome]